MYSIDGWLFKNHKTIKFVPEEPCFNCESFPWEILMSTELLNEMIRQFAVEKDEDRHYEKRYHIITEEKKLCDWFSMAASRGPQLNC